MYCPNCGSEIQENQKFCSNCGTNLEDIINSKNEDISESVENIDTKTEEQNFDNYYKNKSTPLNKTTKIISIIALCIIIVALTVFGIKEYKQYQKDIEPLSVSKVRFDMGNISFDIKYDTNYRQAIIRETFEDIIAEDWLIGYFKDYYDNNFSVNIDKDEVISYPIDVKSNNINIVKGEKPLVKYEINNITAKDFAKIKETFKIGIDRRGSINISTPYALDKNVKNRNRVKKEYLTWKKKVEAQKEAELKQKEWQEKVLSSCVYKTSDGVCFTTTIFNVEPLLEGKNLETKNYWLGAKDYCESRGYKLPSDDNLRSLFHDFLKVEINAGMQIKTFKDMNTTDIPLNYDVVKRIAPDGFYNYKGHDKEWKYITFWENELFDNERAYIRRLSHDGSFSANSYEIHQDIDDLDEYYNRGICVYNPNGKPHKSLVQIQKEKIEKEKKDLEAKKKQNERDIENALF